MPVRTVRVATAELELQGDRRKRVFLGDEFDTDRMTEKALERAERLGVFRPLGLEDPTDIPDEPSEGDDEQTEGSEEPTLFDGIDLEKADAEPVGDGDYVEPTGYTSTPISDDVLKRPRKAGTRADWFAFADQEGMLLGKSLQEREDITKAELQALFDES